MGWDAEVTQLTGDHGVDIKIRRNDSVCIVQCKRYALSNNVGEQALRDLLGAVAFEGAQSGIVVTTASFTKAARRWARKNKAQDIELWDGDRLVELVQQSFAREPRQDATRTRSPTRDGSSVPLNAGLHDRVASNGDQRPSGSGATGASRAQSAAPKQVSSSVNATGHTQTRCPLCGCLTRVRFGKHGAFLGCTAYPRCRWTRRVSHSRRKPSSA